MAIRVRVVKQSEWMGEDMVGWVGNYMCMVHVRPYVGADGLTYKYQYKVDFSEDRDCRHRCYHFDPSEVVIMREVLDGEEVAA